MYEELVTALRKRAVELPEKFSKNAVSPDDFWITRNQAYNERLWKTWCESFYKYLESRPTIIPAEEAK